MNELIAWLFLAAGLLLGALGTVLPGLPGAVFTVVGVVVHKWLLPGILSWWTVGLVGVLAALSWIVDLMGGFLGARWGGATRRGLIGAAIGGLVGLVFGLPGLILGPFLGAVIGDLSAHRRDVVALAKSGGGAAFGFVLSLFLRLILLTAMALLIVGDLLI